MAGVTAAMTTYPLDLVRARLAFHVSTTETLTSNGGTVIVPQKRMTISGTIVNVVRNEGGILALYKGLTPTVLGMIPYAGNINLSMVCTLVVGNISLFGRIIFLRFRAT